MKNKILSLIIAVCIFVLPLTVISFAGEEEDNTVLNSAFYIELPEDFELSYISEDEYNEEYGTGFTYTISDDDDFESFEYVYISILENKIGIDNLEEDTEDANKFFYSVLYNNAYIENEHAKEIMTHKVSELNGYKCIEYSGTDIYSEDSMYEETYYYKGYVFATEETVYSILLENDSDDLSFGKNVLKSFTINGTLLNGDSHKNKVDFTNAQDYKVQAEEFDLTLGSDFEVFDEETNIAARIGMFMFMIPFIILVVVTIIMIVKYSKNKKILQQYEKSFGVMGMGMQPYTNNPMNYGAPSMNNSYMPTQPMQQPTEQMNQNYQEPTDNDGQNNNF